MSISDITGIESFVNISGLNCSNNQISSLDVSSLTQINFLTCRNNQLSSLQLNTNTLLTALNCSGNQLTSLDLSNNPALTDLDISNNQISNVNIGSNTNLLYLAANNNQLTAIDISHCLGFFLIDCSGNHLNTLNLANGNNPNFTYVDARNNSQLYCIQIDDSDTAGYNWNNGSFFFDSGVGFSDNCPSISSTEDQYFNEVSIFPNPSNEFICIDLGTPASVEIFDMYGAIVISAPSKSTHYFNTNFLSKGLYIVRTSTGVIRKFLKE